MSFRSGLIWFHPIIRVLGLFLWYFLLFLASFVLGLPSLKLENSHSCFWTSWLTVHLLDPPWNCCLGSQWSELNHLLIRQANTDQGVELSHYFQLSFIHGLSWVREIPGWLRTVNVVAGTRQWYQWMFAGHMRNVRVTLVPSVSPSNQGKA